MKALICIAMLLLAALSRADGPREGRDRLFEWVTAEPLDHYAGQTAIIESLTQKGASIYPRSGGPRLYEVVLGGFPHTLRPAWSGGDAAYRELASLGGIASLRFILMHPTAAELWHLRNMHLLRTLEFGFGPALEEDRMREIGRCENLEKLRLSVGTDKKGFEHLRSLKKLRMLEADHIADDAMPAIGSLHGLRGLGLAGPRISDTGIKALRELKDLQSLGLANTHVGDQSVAWILGLKRLRKLDLRGTRVSAAKVAEIRNALPRCHVYFESDPPNGDMPIADPDVHASPPHVPSQEPFARLLPASSGRIASN